MGSNFLSLIGLLHSKTMSLKSIHDRSLTLLNHWCAWAENWWYQPPGMDGMGCFGTGFEHWGVQTNQKYVAAAATLAGLGSNLEGVDADHLAAQALAALRFVLATHVTGSCYSTDSRRWGRTWITMLGLERMMFCLPYIEELFTDEDHVALKRVVVSEADYIADDYQRRRFKGVQGGRWNESGKNNGESNLWAGAFAWRAAVMYPDHPNVEKWKEIAHRFLINGISVPADADDPTLIAGQPVSDWHEGANFFENYSFDHHGYMNVGYMVICSSQQAFLHFDLKRQGAEPPDSLYWHAEDLWRVVRKLTFGNGRLARIGGDSRVRYAYCQEYLLPSLMFAADHFADPHAIELTDRILGWIAIEARHNGDGSFYSERLNCLESFSPYFTTRLESDRAVALAMIASYISEGLVNQPPALRESFEASVAGLWVEPEHGNVVHRSSSRLASVSWRTHGIAQAMCQPPDDGHLAEWQNNLTGRVRFTGDPADAKLLKQPQRRLLHHHIETFEGGFVTTGSFIEGVAPTMYEGYRGSEMAVHNIALFALPDNSTMVGLQHCQLNESRGFLAEVKGMLLNIANDIFNRSRRIYRNDGGQWTLESPSIGDDVLPFKSKWISIDDRLAVVGLYGANELTLHRVAERRGGAYHTLDVDELCWGCEFGPFSADAGQVVLDVGWAVSTTGSYKQARGWAKSNLSPTVYSGDSAVRAVSVVGTDGVRYVAAANFGEISADLDVGDQQIAIPPAGAVLMPMTP